MKLRYEAMDGAGKTVSGYREALDVLDAMEGLRRDGLFVSHIEPAAENAGPAAAGGSAARGRARGRIGRGKRLKYLAMFFRQLHVLVSTGTPVVQALGALERQAKDEHWRAVLTDVRLRVEEGE